MTDYGLISTWHWLLKKLFFDFRYSSFKCSRVTERKTVVFESIVQQIISDIVSHVTLMMSRIGICH